MQVKSLKCKMSVSENNTTISVVPPSPNKNGHLSSITGIFRKCLPMATFFMAFATVMTILLLYMDNTALKHHQFRMNMSQDYELLGVAQDNPQLVTYIREVHLKMAVEPNHKPLEMTSFIPPPVTAYVAKLLKNKREGVFVEAGAYRDGKLSTTEWLERKLNWQGLLVQPDPTDYFRLRRHNRMRSQGIHACLSPMSYPKEVTFHQEERDGVKINSIHSNSIVDDSDWFSTRVKCFPLYSLLLAMNCTTINFLSLESDGTELQVLETIPFDRVQVDIINVPASMIKQIAKILKKKSYQVDIQQEFPPGMGNIFTVDSMVHSEYKMSTLNGDAVYFMLIICYRRSFTLWKFVNRTTEGHGQFLQNIMNQRESRQKCSRTPQLDILWLPRAALRSVEADPSDCVLVVGVSRPRMAVAILAIMLLSMFLTFHMLYDSALHSMQSSSIDSRSPSVILLSRRFYPVASQRLPQAIIIGVRKCGTRALLEMLYLHPGIEKAAGEVHFFDRDENYNKGLEWYRTKMPLSHKGQITIEKSPSYFVTPEVPERIRAMNTSVKLLLIVREPVTRAISDYTQLRSHAATATPLSPTPIPRTFEQLALFSNGTINEAYRPIAISTYHNYLHRWLEVFSREQLLVVNGDLLIEDPVPQLQRIERFLGLEPRIGVHNFYFNETKGFYCLRNETSDRCLRETKGRKHPRVNPLIVSKLRKHFGEHNQKFYELVGQDLGWPEE